MCGHYSYFGKEAIDLNKALHPIIHRGPDSSGAAVVNLEDNTIRRERQAALKEGAKIALGFNRLAIIDVESQSDQPFEIEEEGLLMVFNGEIYNYIELRSQLEEAGIKFRTNSDTEVLLRSYAYWGIKCFAKFNGMWAAVIVDRKRRKAVICRDRFGIKPLYYNKNASGYEFYSELKQKLNFDFDRKVNESVIASYLERGILDFSEETFFEGIYRFPAGHYAEISFEDLSAKISPKPFWELSFDPIEDLSYDESCQRFRELFTSSLELRYRSDVPVGACLSGGLDSSSIVSLSGYLGKEINAFHIDNSDPALSELRYVNDIMDKYPKLSLVKDMNQDSDASMLRNMLEIHAEPFSSFSVVAQWRVMKLANENGVKVLLDGQGGDEILGGYRKYLFFYLKELISAGNLALAFSEGRRFLSAKEFKIFEREGVKRYLNLTKASVYYNPDWKAPIKADNAIGLSGATGFQAKSFDDIYKYSYPQLLRYEDLNSMNFSIESRVPFLDYRLVEFVFRIPAGYKIRKGFTKAILRDSMKGILPDSIVMRKSKLGFANSEKKWVEQSFKDQVVESFKTSNNPFINHQKIAKDLANNRLEMDYKTLIRYYIFDNWYKLFFN